ncbi:tryptophan halogenase family protein [Asticcacaulis machinosus]|uniref:Tryptophan 7-halogenase n=1 Tax=Asticcacaulis machinosus TaxID=2984211 RepID=A0ABT5HG12_9CAUL|nr:tryptophan halogenase family protein [Asticcacaulis machinosus]MDC7675070.1 tryptophan 7-halogenase [Asticcacaulis machinosus]
MSRLRKIVIVGGGSAGWMAAVALSRALGQAVNSKTTQIELIESDDIGTVGVGEATVPTIRTFNLDIGLGEVEFIRKTNGSFKLGIEFVNWSRSGKPFFHGFGDYVINEGPHSTLNHWLHLRDQNDPEAGDFDDYSIAAVMARHNRFSAPVNDPRTPLSHFNYAFHFDAGLYARLLKERSIAQGVIRHEGRIVDVTVRPDDGFIQSVTMNDGRTIDGDLFIDCSGFIGLLADKALREPYLDYSHWLPVDRAWAVPCASVSPLTPYTRSTALEAGWQWRIPLQHRIGNGYVFSSAFANEGHARDKLLGNLDGDALAEPRLLKFTTGRRREFWVKNCVAIGLSSGFIEPLESTSIQLIQNGITRLITMLPDMTFNPRLRTEYNRIQALEFDRVRDFIIAHYALSGREDSAFWRYVKHMPLPDTLMEKIETFRETGLLPLLDQESFVLPSWLAILIGMDVMPQRRDPLAGIQDAHKLRAALLSRKDTIAKTVALLPDHAAFIDRHCKADVI